MDDATLHAWKEFMAGPGGKDLLGRFLSDEAFYQMNGMKASSLEGKGLAMAKIEAVYKLRTGVLSIIEPPKVSKPGSS